MTWFVTLIWSAPCRRCETRQKLDSHCTPFCIDRQQNMLLLDMILGDFVHCPFGRMKILHSRSLSLCKRKSTARQISWLACHPVLILSMRSTFQPTLHHRLSLPTLLDKLRFSHLLVCRTKKEQSMHVPV